MIKLVAFDWNGTILADSRLMFKAFNQALKYYNLPILNFKKFQEVYNIPIRDMWIKAGGSEKTLSEQRSIYQPAFLGYSKNVRSRSGIRVILKFLKNKNIKSVVFANHENAEIKKQISRLHLNYFSAILGREEGDLSHMSMRSKEHRLREFIKIYKFDPSEIIIVGDTIEEIEIAKDLQICSVSLTGGCHSVSRLKKAKPNFVISNLMELKKIIKELDFNLSV